MEHRRLKNGNKRDGKLYQSFLLFWKIGKCVKFTILGICKILENPGKWKLLGNKKISKNA